VYCFNRSKEHPVVVFDRDGSYLHSWGAGLFDFPHIIRADKDDNLWLVDRDLAQMMLFTTEGKLLRTIGKRGYRSDTGVSPTNFRSDAWVEVKRGAEPFNLPTDIDVAPNGDIFVTDGYGNARVHKFAPDGTLMFSWGEPGSAPGQFNLPHSIWIDRRGRLLVADRENNRVQIFDQQGKLLEIWPTELIGPAIIYVDRVDMQGNRLAQWGDAMYKSCHGIWGDSHGDIYVVRAGPWGRNRRVVKHVRR
jgi:streptogramin lyase